MGFAEKRGDYYRARFWIAPGKLRTVVDEYGRTIKFKRKAEAAKVANDIEAKVRAGTWRDPAAGRITFGAFVDRWFGMQDLAVSTMENYKTHIESHLLPAFENQALGDIQPKDVAAWRKAKRDAGYAEGSIKTWRGTLHLIFEDAMDEGLIPSNPASVRRGRGKRAGRSRHRAPEKAVTDSLGILHIAERAALLSGRDDEFVLTVLAGYTGMRWGEVVGLEPFYTRREAVRIEWQLYELDSGKLHRCPPKEDSYRDIDLPEWLAELLAGHIARTQPKPCACHRQAYAFRGLGTPKGPGAAAGPRVADVARLAGVSAGTVSNLLNRPEQVSERSRAKVAQAMEELGYLPGGPPAASAAHWRRSGFAQQVFQPAATGWFPRKAPREACPVPLRAEPWPGTPLSGRNSPGRANACWLPIARGLTPHGLRHTHKTVMQELGTPQKLQDERMGHLDGSVQGRYSHVTTSMRQRLLSDLTGLWEAALTARKELSPRSPVGILDTLLTIRQ
ncbi:LacI family DNA-binding transcriptional regulator [Phaeacidiphilus oryzae]|uniref:LacI family DNA-binding transcriptional regulator n=1 Tax=Phaeacidiphilus oryzae TaxID=348818 RepID=UPI0005608CB8|nr:LacI family DNA-binding transcriptional regulator [Phaeacidiphilus oryzae]